MNELLQAFVEWVIGVVHTLGYAGVVGLLVVENVFPPIPSEVILPLAGYLAGRGELTFWGVVAAATIGAVLGALILYELGRRMGHDRLRAILRRTPLMEEADLDRAHEWFEKHGEKAVLLGRLLPGVRSLISIPAGIAEMSLWRFLLYSTIGSALWNAVLAGLGWWAGENWKSVEQYVKPFSYVVTAVIVFLVVRFVWGRLRNGGWTSSTREGKAA